MLEDVFGMSDAHTTELNPETKHPVVDSFARAEGSYKKRGDNASRFPKGADILQLKGG